MTENRRDAISQVLIAVADPVRQQILTLLTEHDGATATLLATKLPVSRQAVVKHLGVLCRAGLTMAWRSGREVIYEVRPRALEEPTRWLAGIAAEWDQRLMTIKRIAESAENGT